MFNHLVAPSKILTEFKAQRYYFVDCAEHNIWVHDFLLQLAIKILTQIKLRERWGKGEGRCAIAFTNHLWNSLQTQWFWTLLVCNAIFHSISISTSISISISISISTSIFFGWTFVELMFPSQFHPFGFYFFYLFRSPLITDNCINPFSF